MKTQHLVNLHFSSVVGQNFSHLEEKVIEEICANFDVNDGKRQKIKINIQEMDEGSVMLSPPMTP